MPFLLHKDDVLSEETAANDYQRWLDADDAADPVQEERLRQEWREARPQEERRMEISG